MTQHLTLHGIARALGGRIVGKTVRAPGPGHSKFDDSLVVTPADNEAGFVVFSHAGDDALSCKDFVRECLGLEAFAPGHVHHLDPRIAAERQAAREAVQLADVEDERQRIERAGGIWRASLPIEGSPAEAYLLRSRFPGFHVPAAVYDGGSLRWHPGERIAGSIGAMIALMTDPFTAKPCGTHRTYINAAGQRVERKMLGKKGVVRLWPDEAVTYGLAIGEGIESTLAGVLITGFAPAWAALDAGQVAGFPVLPAIEALTVFVDNDASGTGQGAAEAVAERWSLVGREVRLLTPKVPGDMNDVLRGAA